VVGIRIIRVFLEVLLQEALGAPELLFRFTPRQVIAVMMESNPGKGRVIYTYETVVDPPFITDDTVVAEDALHAVDALTLPLLGIAYDLDHNGIHVRIGQSRAYKGDILPEELLVGVDLKDPLPSGVGEVMVPASLKLSCQGWK